MKASREPAHEIIRTDIPHRLDRIPWSRWHWLVVPRADLAGLRRVDYTFWRFYHFR